ASAAGAAAGAGAATPAGRAMAGDGAKAAGWAVRGPLAENGHLEARRSAPAARRASLRGAQADSREGGSVARESVTSVAVVMRAPFRIAITATAHGRAVRPPARGQGPPRPGRWAAGTNAWPTAAWSC